MRPVLPCLALSLVFGLACSGFGPSVPVAEHLQSVCALSEIPTVPFDLTLAELDAAPVDVALSTPIEVHPGEVRIFGQPVALETLGERVTPASGGAALVLVHADVEAAQLVEVLGALHRAGMTRPTFLARSKQPVVAPPFPDPAFAAEISAELAGASPADRAFQLAERMSDAVSMCPPAIEAFSAIANAAPDAKCQLIAAAMAESLPYCPLTNGDRVLTLVQIAVQPTDPMRPTAVDWALDPAAEPMVVPGTTPWRELLPTLAQREPRPGWLTVGPAGDAEPAL